MSYTQWTEAGEGALTPVGNTQARIEPGYYDTVAVQGKLLFIPVRARTDDLLTFPDSASEKVLAGIRDFWEREPAFRKYGLPFKRGVLLYGPPGSGKSSTIQLVARDVVERGGVVVTFDPHVFLPAYRALRDIQPETPVVVLMEDLESTLNRSNQSHVLNLLDGVEELDRVLFLASTNYPEQLEDRVLNRPSRFDIRVKVDRPNAEARRMYLSALVQEGDVLDIEAYVKATESLSLAHVKELFIATHILGNSFVESVARIRSMQADKVNSRQDDVDMFSDPFDLDSIKESLGLGQYL